MCLNSDWLSVYNNNENVTDQLSNTFWLYRYALRNAILSNNNIYIVGNTDNRHIRLESFFTATMVEQAGESSQETTEYRMNLWVCGSVVDLKQATLLLEQRNIPTHAILVLVICSCLWNTSSISKSIMKNKIHSTWNCYKNSWTFSWELLLLFFELELFLPFFERISNQVHFSFVAKVPT